MTLTEFFKKRWGLIAALAVWVFIFQELVQHVSQQNTILGRYSPGFFVVLVGFGLLLVPLVWALIRPEPFLEMFRAAVGFVQQRAWLMLPTLAALVGLVIYFSPDGQLENFLDFKLVFILGSALAVPWLILYRWGADGEPPVWRKAALGVLIAAVVFELGIQLLSVGRMLPAGFVNESGLNKPFGRLYDPKNGNRITNRDGWYSKPFALEDSAHRILLLGDESIFARDLPTEAHLSEALEDRLGPEYEVIAMGVPGYGTAQYYEGVKLTIEYYRPDEIIMFVNLPSDLVNMVPSLNARSPRTYVYYRFENDGSLELHPASYFPQHLLSHRYSEGVHPLHETLLLTIRSHLMGGKLIEHLFFAPEPSADGPDPERVFYTDSWSEEAETALALTVEVLKLSRQTAAAGGVAFRVVSLPRISPELGAQLAGTGAALADEPELLRPERRLIEAAAADGLEILSIGMMLEEDGVRFEELLDLYGSESCGCWTPEGYARIADHLVEAFYGGR